MCLSIVSTKQKITKGDNLSITKKSKGDNLRKTQHILNLGLESYSNLLVCLDNPETSYCFNKILDLRDKWQVRQQVCVISTRRHSIELQYTLSRYQVFSIKFQQDSSIAYL